MITVTAADPRTPSIAVLITQLDDYQLALYPRQFCYLDSPDELAGSDTHFVSAHAGDGNDSKDNRPLGCGAIKYVHGDCFYGEVKRLFVAAEARGRGVSKKIMANLEAHAVGKQVACIRLETGIHQPEAIRLYARRGYKRRGPFGNYADDPLSVFMEKMAGEL